MSMRTAQSGSNAQTNAPKETPLVCQRKRFCGLPSGVRIDPAFTDNAITMTRRLMGKGASRCSDSASGTTANNATSLVSTVDSAAASATSSSARPRSPWM